MHYNFYIILGNGQDILAATGTVAGHVLTPVMYYILHFYQYRIYYNRRDFPSKTSPKNLDPSY